MKKKKQVKTTLGEKYAGDDRDERRNMDAVCQATEIEEARNKYICGY